MSAMGSDLTITIDEAGSIGVEAAMGAFDLITTSLTDGDAFNSLTLDYSAGLAEGLSLDASLSGGAATSLSIGTTCHSNLFFRF